MSIMRFEIRHTRHPGCSYRGQTVAVDGDADGAITRAAYEIARIHLWREQAEAVGGGGNVGCGSHRIVIVLDCEDADEIDADTPEGRARVAALPPGRVDQRVVAELSEPVWDGSNWVSPDVSGIATGDSYGHWDAADWLGQAGLNGTEDADELVDDAADQGVHLDADDVAKFLASRRGR